MSKKVTPGLLVFEKLTFKIKLEFDSSCLNSSLLHGQMNLDLEQLWPFPYIFGRSWPISTQSRRKQGVERGVGGSGVVDIIKYFIILLKTPPT